MQWINLITLLITLVANGLANALPLNNRTTGEISDSFPVLFTPAGYVFAIWGVIYLGLIAFGIYQALPAQREDPRLKRIGPWFAVANLFNAAWIFLWHYGFFTLTVLVMLGLLTSLLIIFKRLNLSVKPATTMENWLMHVPFSIYLGWISVATIANVSVALYNLGFTGGPISQEAWTVVVILVALALGIFMTWQQRQVAYSLVLIWATIGIVVRQADSTVVMATSILAAAILFVSVVVYAYGVWQKSKHTQSRAEVV